MDIGPFFAIFGIAVTTACLKLIAMGVLHMYGVVKLKIIKAQMKVDFYKDAKNLLLMPAYNSKLMVAKDPIIIDGFYNFDLLVSSKNIDQYRHVLIYNFHVLLNIKNISNVCIMHRYVITNNNVTDAIFMFTMILDNQIQRVEYMHNIMPNQMQLLSCDI